MAVELFEEVIGCIQEAPVNPKTYIAIDMKSFYASVECVYRGMNLLDGAMTRERNEQIGGHKA